MSSQSLGQLVHATFQEYRDLVFEIVEDSDPKGFSRRKLRRSKRLITAETETKPVGDSLLEIQASTYLGWLDGYSEWNDAVITPLTKNIVITRRNIEEAKEHEALLEKGHLSSRKYANFVNIASAAILAPTAYYFHLAFGPMYSVPFAVSTTSFVADVITKKDRNFTTWTWAAYTTAGLPLVSMLSDPNIDLSNPSLNLDLSMNVLFLASSLFFGYIHPQLMRMDFISPAKIKRARGLERALPKIGRLRNIEERLRYTLIIASTLQEVEGVDWEEYQDQVSDLEDLCGRYIRHEIGRSKIVRALQAIDTKARSRQGVAPKAAVEDKPDVFDYLTEQGYSDESARSLSNLVTHEQARDAISRFRGLYGELTNDILQQHPAVITLVGKRRKSYVGAFLTLKKTHNTTDTPTSFSDYVRENLAFTGTEDGLRVLIHSLAHQEEDESDVTETRQPYLQVDKLTYTRKYLRDVRKHPDLQSRTEKAEERILRLSTYSSNHHQCFIGPDPKWRKAHIDRNFRIVYTWSPETRELRFERLLNHNEVNYYINRS